MPPTTAEACPVTTGNTDNADELGALCQRYHGFKGKYVYQCFQWCQENLYDNALPIPLIQWALTPYGKCIGYTQPQKSDSPVITLHPTVWINNVSGRLQTLDLVIHELLHCWIIYHLGHWNTPGKSSHDNKVWAAEVSRLSEKLGILDIQAKPTTRIREDGHQRRITPDGCISMRALSTWPQSVRPAEYWNDPDNLPNELKGAL